MKKVLMIIGGIVIGAFILGAIILVVFNLVSDKLVCKSTEGNITILHNDNKLTGYTSKGNISFDYDTQKVLAEKIGIESYLTQFEDWFDNNTDGSCERK